MRTRNKQINLDRAVGAEEHASQQEATMRNSSKKTPWHLRFAPGAILRPIGRLVSKAVSLGIAIIQPVRRQLNQWNWRKKTALVTALAITAVGNFVYQYKANAGWPLAIAASVGTDFLVNVVASYASSRLINSKIKKTANANPDDFLYSNREYYERNYSYDDSGAKTEGRSIDADANALYDQSYETSGTDTRYDPSTLEQREVLDYVSHNANLNGTTEEYQILHYGEPLYQWDGRRPSRRWLQTYVVHYGGYVKKLTAAEMQEELDDYREEWNRGFRRGYVSPHRRPFLIGPLTLGPKVSQVDKRFVCDKEVRLWSKFKFNRVAGDTSAGPDELQQPGQRSTYVTSFSYYAREAGYGHYYGLITTKTPQNEEPFIEYPKPRSHNNHRYMEHDLDSIIWANYKIMERPVWTGEATRFFKHKKIKGWCTTHNKRHFLGMRTNYKGICRFTTRHEIPVYQNESVEEPSN